MYVAELVLWSEEPMKSRPAARARLDHLDQPPALARLEPQNDPPVLAAPGMDLIDLFIGSEGTLGVIVEAELALIRMRLPPR